MLVMGNLRNSKLRNSKLQNAKIVCENLVDCETKWEKYVFVLILPRIFYSKIKVKTSG